ncbi:hypothetical protein BJX64DRAFT_296384 [Aspergillus heterothallicus]
MSYSIFPLPKLTQPLPKGSCVACRKRKIRCDRDRPCSSCVRSRGGAARCVYDCGTLLRPGSGSGAVSHAPSRTMGWGQLEPGMPTPSSEQSVQDAENARLRARVRELEWQLESASRARTTPAAASDAGNFSGVETTTTRLGGTFQLHYRKDERGQHQPVVQSVSVKTRMFGQSHWGVGIEKCKSLARHIKALQTPSHPLQPAALPSRQVADMLLTNYLRQTESIYRIIHIPSFIWQYDQLWAGGPTTQPYNHADPRSESETPFLVQLKLILALGAVTYDETFSLRTSAIHWIHEAQEWMSGPKYKSRLNIHSLQTSLLLLLAQERVGVIGDLPWVSAGAVLRKAMHMGLHRDPINISHKTTTAATPVSVEMHPSLTSGGAPLLSLTDFDTLPPANFDDEQLELPNLVPKLDGELTQTLVAIELRRTFPQRLAVVKFLNDIAPTGSYEDMLRLDVQLRAACRRLSVALRGCSRLVGCPPSFEYEVKAADLLMNRYISALHVPYFAPSLQVPVPGPGAGVTYAFSRKTVIDCALKIWRAATYTENDPLPRLVTCSAGFYPSIAIHAAFLVAVELRTQFREDEGVCLPPLRPDLLAVLEEARAWCLRVIRAGETNVKGYLLVTLVAAHVDGFIMGFTHGEEGMAGLLVRYVERVGDVCVPILEGLIAELQGESAGGEIEGQTGAGHGAQQLEFLTAGEAFDFDAEPLRWMFNDDFGPEMSLFG